MPSSNTPILSATSENESTSNTPTIENDYKESYDFVIIGTGLAETAISCILAKTGKYKILHIDTNSSYGSEFATLQYKQLEDHFNTPEDKISQEFLKFNREFNIDLTPKLLLQDSKLKDFLLENEIHDLVSFTSIKGSYLYSNKLHSVPTNEAQALKSSAISFLQKPRVIRFFWHVRNYFKDNTIKTKGTTKEELEYFSLNSDSIDFIGHAIALNLDDNYLHQDPKITYSKIMRYISSIVCYEGTESPYIYPLYGLSELCQSFARRSALHGTLFMLNANIKNIDKSEIRLVDPNGDNHTITARKIIADPKYFSTSKVARKIIRCIMICKREDRTSRNIIFLKKQLARKNDIFCVILTSEEMACPVGYEVGIISTVQEGNDPENEIQPILNKFNILKKFIEVRSLLQNDDDENVIFTGGVDESALMDNIYEDIESILKKKNF